MFGKKCTLCGGKIDNHNICTECGLDNTKTDENYHMNESSCDHMPLTHVHKNKSAEQTKDPGKYNQSPAAAKKNQNQADGWRQAESGWNRKSKGSRKGQTRVSKIITVITVVFTIAGILLNVLEDHISDIAVWAENTFNSGDAVIGGDAATGGDDADYDPYAFTERSIPIEGDSAEYTLPCGQYIAGVHIPEGIYTVIPGSDYDAVDIQDKDNSIYLYEYVESKDEIMEDIRLYTGALLTVQCKETVMLRTDNAQSQEMNGLENPLTQTVRMDQGKSMTAGSEFPAGIYDLKRMSGEGSFIIKVFDRQGQELTTEEFGMYEGGDNQQYHYLVLPEAAVITVSSSLSVSMEPTDIIESEDYQGFYERYR